MGANVEKFIPPNCTRFGGIRNGKVVCRLNDAFMTVPPVECHCAYQYENRYARKKTDGAERVRLFCEGERLRIENRTPDFYEDLKIGDQLPEKEDTSETQINFIVEEPHFVYEEEALPEPVEEVEEVEPVEEIEEAEELPQEPYFAMTRFGQNEEPVLELRGEGDTIIEHNGVYSIADNLSYTKVLLNKEFKTLVDSVLQN